MVAAPNCDGLGKLSDQRVTQTVDSLDTSVQPASGAINAIIGGHYQCVT